MISWTWPGRVTSGGWDDIIARVPDIVSFVALLRRTLTVSMMTCVRYLAAHVKLPSSRAPLAVQNCHRGCQGGVASFFPPFYFVAFKVKVTVEGQKKILLHLG
jgi:hypothetical protein